MLLCKWGRKGKVFERKGANLLSLFSVRKGAAAGKKDRTGKCRSECPPPDRQANHFRKSSMEHPGGGKPESLLTLTVREGGNMIRAANKKGKPEEKENDLDSFISI